MAFFFLLSREGVQVHLKKRVQMTKTATNSRFFNIKCIMYVFVKNKVDAGGVTTLYSIAFS